MLTRDFTISRRCPGEFHGCFRRAAEHGYGIGLDVQLTRDGQVIVAHDYDLKRICGIEKEIDSLTYEELSRFPILGTEEPD